MFQCRPATVSQHPPSSQQMLADRRVRPCNPVKAMRRWRSVQQPVPPRVWSPVTYRTVGLLRVAVRSRDYFATSVARPRTDQLKTGDTRPSPNTCGNCVSSINRRPLANDLHRLANIHLRRCDPDRLTLSCYYLESSISCAISAICSQQPHASNWYISWNYQSKLHGDSKLKRVS
jgi:hypothetical protein